jgi:hypothetical protein
MINLEEMQLLSTEEMKEATTAVLECSQEKGCRSASSSAMATDGNL